MSTNSPQRRNRLMVAWAVVALVVVAALAVGVFGQDEPSDSERARNVAETIRCPSCESQSAASSDTPSSQAVRALIAERIAAGDSDEAIRDFAASQYGEEILLEPPAQGVSALVWVLPVVLVFLAIAGLAVRFRDYRPEGRTPTKADRDLVADALAGSASESSSGPAAGDSK